MILCSIIAIMEDKINLFEAYKERVGLMKDQFLDDVYEFCKNAKMLRNAHNCAKYYNNKYDEDDCRAAIQYLFNTRKMGAYYFEKNADPQKYMKKYILEKIPSIDAQSCILEMGPGNLPLFAENEYINWRGIDYNNKEGIIEFSGKNWGGFYQHIFTGGWDNISEVVQAEIDLKKYDLVCGSHSFEHCFKPITALREVTKVLKPGGHLAIFVPDGFSTWEGNYDRTHTLYMVPDMVEDFINSAGGLELLICEQFRINMDLVVIAQKCI